MLRMKNRAEKKPLRILAVSDIHGDQTRLAQLVARAEKEKVDLVLLCGDFTFGDELAGPLIQPFLAKGKRVLLVPGNHESLATAEFLAERYKIRNLHGKGVRYDDIGFFGCGGANIGIHQLSDDEIYEQLRHGFEQIKSCRKKIMITHIHPSRSIQEKMGLFPGSEGVARALKSFKPELLLCGHVHEAEGLEESLKGTRIVNVSKSGKVLEL